MTTVHMLRDDITIRAATNADRERIETFVLAMLKELKLEVNNEVSEADLRDIEVSYSGGMFAVVERGDGTLVGTVGFQRVKDEADVTKLRKMYLDLSLRKKGIGRLMLEYMLQAASEMGYKTMRLETIHTLTDAIRLYTRAGFVPVDIPPVSPRCDQVYEKSLV